MILEHRAEAPFFKNGFVIGCEETREGVIVDPGDEVDRLLDEAKRHGLTITMILLTHAHLDHVTGVGRAKQVLGVPVWLHADDNFLYEQVVQQGQMFGLRVEPQPPVDHFYDGEGPLRFGRYTVRVRHTPGHCPGGVCLAVSRGRRFGGPGPKETSPVCRRHALRGLDRPHRSAGRRPADLAAIDPRGAVQLSRRHGRVVGPRRADDDRPRKTNEPVPNLISRRTDRRVRPRDDPRFSESPVRRVRH